MDYITVKICKATLYITPYEINKLLMKDVQLYTDILKRSKAITRHKQKQSQYEAKWSTYEGDKLKDI
jgi:hypothetical protein